MRDNAVSHPAVPSGFYVWAVVLTALSELAHPFSTWDCDVACAEHELEATATQAAVLSLHAFAWRFALVTAPLALASTLIAVIAEDVDLVAIPLAIVIGFLAPLVAVVFLTLPLVFWAMGETWFKGSRDGQIRFGSTALVFPYYGWRHAFRGRTRPWGALTHDERIASNPARVGVPTQPPPRRNYWPE
jgi:hypothetical protein